MLRFLALVALLVLPVAGHAQTGRIPTCATATPGPGSSQPTMDQNGNTCVTVSPVPFRGNGSLATSTASAAINTMTVNSSGTALPSTLSVLVAVNIGSSDVAMCIAGGTCTCPENTIAATNGVTLAAKGGYQFTLSGVLSSTPTIVACSGTPTVQFAW